MGHGKVYMMPKLFLEFVNESLEELVKEATNYCKVHKIIGEKYYKVYPISLKSI